MLFSICDPPHEKTTSASSTSPVRDLYEVLNVARKASSREIRRAYRELARKYHPDLNPSDPAAAQKFREVQEAYEVLGNSRKRKAYDYYGANFSDRIPARAPARRADLVRQPGAFHSISSPASYSSSSTTREFAASAPSVSPEVFPRLIRRARLGSLTVAPVFAVGTIGYLLLPSSGVQEFKRAQEALRQVSSWKVQTGEEYSAEVSCPSSARTTQHFRGSPGVSDDFVLEAIVIGNDRYAYNNRSKSWTHDSTGGLGRSGPCVYLQNAQDARGLPPLRKWLNNSSVIEKENLRETPEGKCREWKIVTPGGYSVPSAEYVCLGMKDHLPRFQGVPGSPQETRFYDWNVPIQITAPESASSP
jgi:curved DNA-binding protein CbpA